MDDIKGNINWNYNQEQIIWTIHFRDITLLPRSFAVIEREKPFVDLLTTHFLSKHPESHVSPAL